MRIYGLDFTSAPSERKPIVVAVGELDETVSDVTLGLRSILRIDSLDGFSECLAQAGPWCAAMDLPFGQPRRLIAALGWPSEWSEMVEGLASRPRVVFEEALMNYKAGRPKGDKEHLRLTDRFAGSSSAMKLHGIPLAKMFFEGAPRILACGADVIPCQRRVSDRIVIEGYPVLVARTIVGRRSYKSDKAAKQNQERLKARREIVAGLSSELIRTRYGIQIELGARLAGEMVDDARGDVLDAALAAIQAAWAFTHRERNFGVPLAADGLEGWIVDPATTVPGQH